MTPIISVPPEPTGSTGAAPQLFCDQGQVTSLSLLISVLSLIIKCISLAKDLGSFRKAQKASKDDSEQLVSSKLTVVLLIRPVVFGWVFYHLSIYSQYDTHFRMVRKIATTGIY